MDANTLRLILIVVGVMLIIALYIWERRRARADLDDDTGHDDPVHWQDRREPDFDSWEAPAAGGLGGSGRPQTDKPPMGRAELFFPENRFTPVREPPAPPEPAPDLSQPLIVQLSVVAPVGGRFEGADVVRAASACGLEPGEMDVFHCYLGDENARHTLFRVANLVKPGTFPLGGMESFSTPGLVLFASLEGDPGDLAIVDEMVATARGLADELGGEIRDETRNPFTPAKEETLRARVLARQLAREDEADGP